MAQNTLLDEEQNEIALAEARKSATGPVKKRRVDIDPQGSSHTGLSGMFEVVLRRFKAVIHAVTLFPLFGAASVCLGISLVPGYLLFKAVSGFTEKSADFVRAPALCIALAAGFYLYGFTLICVVPLFNRIFCRKLRAWRGPYYSLEAVKWYMHNGLTYLVRYSFLEFITPTPFNLFFYRAMGMKIGAGTQINTSHISDPSLIEMGERVTIGGSATLIAHYGMAGYLVIAPLKIGRGATIGLRAIVMGGAEIGEHAKILPGSVILPKTKVPAGETWGGVPARKIDPRKSE